MAEIVYGEEEFSEALRNLVNLLQAPEFGGTLYIGYPILTNIEGTVRVDALYVSPDAGVVIFDFENLGVTPDQVDAIVELQRSQDRYFAAIHAKLLETPELLSRRKLLVPITIISVSTTHDFKANDAVISTIENIADVIPSGAHIGESSYRVLSSVIERTATIRPTKKRVRAKTQGSRGSILKEIEKHIANLDAWQKRAAIEMPLGPQRIRGLAGSGKTIVLALKAAFLHSKEPEWRIALTFQTRSLYQQFRRLVSQFCFEFAKEEPNWERLTILHAWGSGSSPGVYSEMAKTIDRPILDFNTAKSKFGVASAFQGACFELLQSTQNLTSTPQIFDVLLIDEAQDLPQPFFELAYLFTKPPKRIVYAYDELQNLSDFSMMPAEDLFGRKKNGHPNLRLRNEPGRPKQDIILPVCYRNSPWALSTAHGLGFGTAREAGLIQMFEEPGLWKEIGYEVVEGELANGHEVALRRAPSATPNYFFELLAREDAVKFKSFASLELELEWLANAVKQNLEQDEIDFDDILIVVPEAITIRSTAPKIMRALRRHGIGSHLVGVTTSRDAVFSDKSIAITSIYRAKGNEAPMVYVVGAEYCQGGFNLARKRNILFTAITRSRAWVRISGVGPAMDNLILEYRKIVEDNFDLSFHYPTLAQLKQIRTLHRDRSSDEITEIEQDLDGLARLIQRVDSGQISIDALPLDAQRMIRRLSDENR